MKYYYDIINNSVFSIANFEYTLRDNQDYEITEEEFNNYFDKLNNFYDVAVEQTGKNEKRQVVFHLRISHFTHIHFCLLTS